MVVVPSLLMGERKGWAQGEVPQANIALEEAGAVMVGAGVGAAGVLPKANGALEGAGAGAVVVGRGAAPNANTGAWVVVVGFSSLQRFLEDRCCSCALLFPRWSLD